MVLISAAMEVLTRTYTFQEAHVSFAVAFSVAREPTHVAAINPFTQYYLSLRSRHKKSSEVPEAMKLMLM